MFIESEKKFEEYPKNELSSCLCLFTWICPALKVDAIIVASATDTHFPLIMQSLRAHKALVNIEQFAERFMGGDVCFHLLSYYMKGSGGASKVIRQFPCSNRRSSPRSPSHTRSPRSRINNKRIRMIKLNDNKTIN